MKSTILVLLTATLSLTLQAQDLELIIPTGHTRQVLDIEVSPDTSTVASIQNGQEIIIWDYQTQALDRILRYHQNRVNDLLFIGNSLWSASEDSTIRSWDYTKKRSVAELTTAAPVVALRSYQSTLVSFSENGGITRWNLTGRAVDASLAIEEKITHVSNVLNGEVLCATGNNEIVVIDLEGLSVRAQISLDGEVGALAISAGHYHIGTLAGEIVSYGRDRQGIVNRQRVLETRIYAIQSRNNELLIAGRGNNGSFATMTVPGFGVSKPEFELGSNARLAEIGIRAITSGYGEERLLIADGGHVLREFHGTTTKPAKVFAGQAYEIEDFAFSEDEAMVAIASTQDAIKIFDLKESRAHKTIAGHIGGTKAVAFHPTDTLLASVGNDDQLRVWNLNTGEQFASFELRGNYRSTSITFDETGRYLIRKGDDKFFELFRLDKSKSRKLNVANGLDYKFARNGELILFQTREGFRIYDSETLKEVRAYPLPGIRDFDVSNGRIVATGTFGIRLFDLNFADKGQIKDNQGIDRIYLHPSGRQAVGTINSAKKGSSKRDYSLKIFDLVRGKFSKAVNAHEGFVSKVGFLKGGEFMMTGASDGQIKIFRKLDSLAVGKLIPLAGAEWVALTETGLYDASSGAFEALHYVQGDRHIALDQLKDQYFEPKLVPRLLGNILEPLPTRRSLDELAPHPEIQIKHPNNNGGILGVNLADGGGGIGRVIILINGKEVVREGLDRDDSQSTSIGYRVEGHPFLKPNAVNRLSIKAYNKEGSLASPQERIYYFDSSKGDEVKPKFYALVVGSGDYPGLAMDLNYAVKDAVDLSNALKSSATNYFGKENTVVELLHTEYADTSQWPTKANIINKLQRFAQEASAQDYLLLYFSGHGMTYGDPHEDFYYLTPMATDEITNAENRRNKTLSSQELTELIKTIPALKQVLIFDACHSGKVATNIGEPKSTLTSGQVKAFETMKDRTGLYVIAGSESDAVSYETSLFQQGLLTYSILFGMKGAALTGTGEVDIIDLLQFVSDKVPELASEIGGVQFPEVRVPAGAESFSIGRMSPEDRAKIQLAGSKPVFIHSGFQEDNLYYDEIGLSAKVDELLLDISEGEDTPIVFLDKKQFASAYQLRGRYRLEGERWKAHIRLFKDRQLIRESDLSGVNAGVLADKIAAWALQER